ncbi:MAG: Uma2 family endonuclease [Acidobacteria bacterium]|jgi:Uma2 family endonuclease|nr:Uma2 family endonuclease [Acidobacteriota bacterium]
MSQATAEKLMSVEEYLAFEEKSKIKHEYMDGKIFSMAGATRKHNLTTTNISTELNLQLREENCEVYASDFRVKIRDGHNVYPDVAVVCGEILTESNETTLLNPTVVFEVLSKSTEKRDRSDKAEDYFKLDSLKDYVLVSQYRVRIEHFSKQKNNEWNLKIFEDLEDVLELKTINCKIPLKLIYLKLKLTSLKLVEKKKKNGK